VGSAAVGFSDAGVSAQAGVEPPGEQLEDVEEVGGVLGLGIRIFITLVMLYVILKMLEILYGLPVPL